VLEYVEAVCRRLDTVHLRVCICRERIWEWYIHYWVSSISFLPHI